MSSASPVESRAHELRACATRRWLVKDELVFLLLHHRQQSAIPCHRSLLQRPESGTLLFYDVKEVPDFKKDGWRWQKRKDNSGRVREDRAKLVINREVIILGTYVHSAETPTFHRRNYYLRDATDGVMLVHYFDEVHKGEGLGTPIVPPLYAWEPIKGVKRALPPSVSASDATYTPSIKLDPYTSSDAMDTMMNECFAMDGPLPPHSPSSLHHGFDDDALLSDLSSLLSPCAATTITTPAPSDATHQLVAISDFSPDWDFVTGGAKVLVCLASPLQLTTNLFVQFGHGVRVPAECLSDTVVRCSAPPSAAAATVELFVGATSSSSSDFFQLSTVGQFQYKHQPTPTRSDDLVGVQLVGGGSSKRGRSPVATTRAVPPTEARRRSYPDCLTLSAFGDADLDERQSKIRVVERLAEFQDVIRTTHSLDANTAAATDTNTSIDANSPTLPPPATPTSDTSMDDGAIEALSDESLEMLSEQLIENVVRQLVTVAHNSDELLEELNSLDETGLSLLHYVSFYSYAHLVTLLLAHGAHVNQQSTQGATPLHLAAGCGHEAVVKELVAAGADLLVLDFDGLTAAERADKVGHPSVAQFLRQQMGDVSMWSSEALWGAEAMDVDSDDAYSPDAGFHQPDPETASSQLSDDSPPTLANSRYADENQEHNRKLLLGAFSTMSLHDKCALSLSISRDLTPSTNSTTNSNSTSRRRGSSMSEDSFAALMSSASSPSKPPNANSSNANSPTLDALSHSTLSLPDSISDSADVQSVIADDEASLTKLEAAMELMGPEELQSLEEEARVIQYNVRAWLLRRNCRHMRETTKKLDAAARSIQQDHKLERAAVTVQAAARSMLARKSFLQTRHVAIKVQAATRGVLCRKNFKRMKTHALASLVIQRNVREWLSKSGGTNQGTTTSGDEVGYTTPPTTMLETMAEEEEEGDDDRLVRELHAALDTVDAFAL